MAFPYILDLYMKIFEGYITERFEVLDFEPGGGSLSENDDAEQIILLNRDVRQCFYFSGHANLHQVARKLFIQEEKHHFTVTDDVRDLAFGQIVFNNREFVRWCFPVFAYVYFALMQQKLARISDLLSFTLLPNRLYLRLIKHVLIAKNQLRGDEWTLPLSAFDFSQKTPYGFLQMMQSLGLEDEWRDYLKNTEDAQEQLATFARDQFARIEKNQQMLTRPSWFLAPPGVDGYKQLKYRLVLTTEDAHVLSGVLLRRMKFPPRNIRQWKGILGSKLRLELLKLGYLYEKQESDGRRFDLVNVEKILLTQFEIGSRQHFERLPDESKLYREVIWEDVMLALFDQAQDQIRAKNPPQTTKAVKKALAKVA